MNKAQLLSAFRGLLKAGAGALAAHGVTQASATSELTQLAGAGITALVAFVWSHSVHADGPSTSGTASTPPPAKAGFLNLRMLFSVAALSMAFVAAPLVWQGCSTTAQRQAVNTIGSVEDAGTAAVDSYFSLVVAGKLSTNDLPRVSQAYNSLQASVKAALTLVQNNTNALAPANLITEQMDLVNLINQIKGK